MSAPRKPSVSTRYVRENLHTSNALVGTCRIGGADDAGAVVDAALRVRGVRGVRVCDASVMPTIPGGQTGAATVMIGEKAADLILGRAAPAAVGRAAAVAAVATDGVDHVAAPPVALAAA